LNVDDSPKRQMKLPSGPEAPANLVHEIPSLLDRWQPPVLYFESISPKATDGSRKIPRERCGVHMPFESEIFSEMRLVVTRARGSISAQEFRTHQKSLGKERGFHPDYNHLFDLTEAVELEISVPEIRELASTALFSPSSLRAVVANRDAAFGLSRMYEGFSHLPEGSLRVFRSSGDALEWLGLDRRAV